MAEKAAEMIKVNAAIDDVNNEAVADAVIVAAAAFAASTEANTVGPRECLPPRHRQA